VPPLEPVLVKGEDGVSAIVLSEALVDGPLVTTME
jgi:hypothetical protein